MPSGNRILITSRREGISDLSPYIGLYFTVLDLKELSNEQQRSVIRAQVPIPSTHRGARDMDQLLAASYAGLESLTRCLLPRALC